LACQEQAMGNQFLTADVQLKETRKAKNVKQHKNKHPTTTTLKGTSSKAHLLMMALNINQL